MVLICGGNLATNDLPLCDSIDYKIVPASSVPLAIKTQARQPACVTVYLLSTLKNCLKGQPVSVTEKTVLFDDEADLISLINEANNISTPKAVSSKYESVTSLFNTNGGTDAEPTKVNTVSNVVSEPVKAVSTEQVIPTATVKDSSVATDGNKSQNNIADVSADDLIEEVDVSLPDTFNCEPYDDTDSLKIRLKNKESQLQQAYAMLKEANDNAQVAYEEQAKALTDMKSVYEKKLYEAQAVIESYKDKVNELQSSSGKYEVYSSHPNALLQEGFSSDEKSVINGLGIDLQVMFNGTDVYRMYDTVKKTIEYSKEGYVFIDLVGDYILSRTYNAKESSALLLLNKMSNKDVERVTANIVNVGNSQIVTCKPYHDVMLLDIDWGIALSNIKKIFPNRKIVLLFGSIQSFAVEYTVSKFATLFRTTVFVKCSPFGINFVYGKMKFIPTSRGIKWMVSDYYDGSETLLKKVSDEYSVKSGDLMTLDDMK